MLMNYPLYAYFMNTYLKILNQIRQILQVISLARVLHTTQIAFQSIIDALNVSYGNMTMEHEKELAKELAYTFRDLVIPHIDYCLRLTFPQDITVLGQFFEKVSEGMPDFMISEEKHVHMP
jgi:hypothetical protein